eukprot:1179657-Prorocentrum_minimum.AAC.11
MTNQGQKPGLFQLEIPAVRFRSAVRSRLTGTGAYSILDSKRLLHRSNYKASQQPSPHLLHKHVEGLRRVDILQHLGDLGHGEADHDFEELETQQAVVVLHLLQLRALLHEPAESAPVGYFYVTLRGYFYVTLRSCFYVRLPPCTGGDSCVALRPPPSSTIGCYYVTPP